MGREILRVPKGFEHPRDEDGELIPGAHLELLWYASEEEKPCFQIYENLSEGSPVSPVFNSEDEMRFWLNTQGNNQDTISQFISMGHYPSLVIKDAYQ